jgi:hypothetical protein
MFNVYVDMENVDFGSVAESTMPGSKTIETVKKVGNMLEIFAGKAKDTLTAIAGEAVSAVSVNKNDLKDGLALGAVRLFNKAIVDKLNDMFDEEKLGLKANGIKHNKTGQSEYRLHLTITDVNYETLMLTKLPFIMEKTSAAMKEKSMTELFGLISQIPTNAFIAFIKEIPADTRDDIALLLIESNSDRIVYAISDEAASRNIKVTIKSVKVERAGAEITNITNSN